MADCPSLEALEAFLANPSPDGGLRSHVNSCVQCRQAAEEIRRENALLGELQDAAVDASLDPFQSHAADSPEGYEISPRIIETDMTTGDSVKDYYNSKIAGGMAPINRWGKPEEVAAAVGAIARGHFPFSTGTVFHVDGGWHLREL